MSSILSQPVLVLNRNWQPIEERTVEKAITDMTGGSAPKLAMHVELIEMPDGTFKLGTGTRPVSWEEWLTLPIRNDFHQDRIIGAHRFTMRGPTVLICANYGDMHMVGEKWSTDAVRRRDKGVCQVTRQE